MEPRLRLVRGFKARRVAGHDVVDFKPVLEKARPGPGFVVVADKGYDAEHVHEYVRGGAGMIRGDPVEAHGCARLEDEGEVQEGDEEGLREETLQSEEQGRDGPQRREAPPWGSTLSSRPVRTQNR